MNKNSATSSHQREGNILSKNGNIPREKKVFAQLWHKGVELFKFLPIRFKLSLIIGSIVVAVILVFSIFVIQSQKITLMNRMTQVCEVLIQSLAETVKGDLITGEKEKVMEAVFRLQNTKIEGLKSVAVMNYKGEIIAQFDQSGQTIQFDDVNKILNIQDFVIQEGDQTFEFFYPIISQIRNEKVQLGIAYISFSKKSILAPIHHARNIAIAVTLIVVFFAILVINIVAYKMARQIQLLSQGAREVGKGNLDVQIKVSSKDELGQLAHEFNKMIQHLKEKLHMQKFISKFTVEMIRDTVRDKSMDRQVQMKNVVVLFSDVRNFSGIAEQLQPEEIVKLINIYFDLQTQIIEKHGGVVDKFMGDQIMAIFEGANMADNALRAAVDIQRNLRLLNQERLQRGEVTLEIGIGINHGNAIMGHMGSKSRMDYTLIGDVVNVAARLCAQASAGQIVTSLEVARNVNGSYPTTRLKSVLVKGRTQKIEVCEVDYNKEIIF